MSDHDASAHVPDPAHHADDHDAGHDDHHEADALGPIDWRMWGVGVLGVVAALAVVAAWVLATSFVFLDQLA
jgi:hypothetical protein